MPLTRKVDSSINTEVSVDGATQKDGSTVPNLNIRYGDRVILHVTPVDAQLPIDELLAQPSTTNTCGESKVNYSITVRGLPAIARDSGVQAWDSNGDGEAEVSNAYPAIVEWVDDDSTGQLLDYRLVGDLPVAALRGMAESLRPVTTE